MKILSAILVSVFLTASAFINTFHSKTDTMTQEQSNLFPELALYTSTLKDGFGTIPAERKTDLEALARFIAEQRTSGQPVKLTFICTHNSRRSHFGQVWAAVAASYYNIPNVETYSGGTEVTACNPRSVAALQRAGLRVAELSQGANPRYAIRYSDQAKHIEAFSKRFMEAPNPSENFCAIMTCTQADEACPFVPGASQRIALPYTDPKEADGSAQEAQVYDERCRQIATEMFYTFYMVTKN
jgi:protein-tyrosine-phosphatase